MFMLELKNLYEDCVRKYLLLIKASVQDVTGNVERIAFDAIRFVLICRTIGLATAQLDPPLTRYHPHISDELQRLSHSLEQALGPLSPSSPDDCEKTKQPKLVQSESNFPPLAYADLLQKEYPVKIRSSDVLGD